MLRSSVLAPCGLVLVALCASTSPCGAVTRTCSTVSALTTAMGSYNSGDVILIMPGTYNLPTSGYYLARGSVTVRGSTGNRGDVVLYGGGMNNASGTQQGIQWESDDVTVRDLTVSGCYYHGLHIQPGADRSVIDNVHVLNCGEQFIKGGGATTPMNGGTIRNCLLEQTEARIPGGRLANYIGGIDLHYAVDFQIHDNTAIHIKGETDGGDAGIFLWNGSTNCTLERNVIIGCQKGIALGNPSSQNKFEAVGCLVRNNFIVRENNNDIGVELGYTKDCKLYNNTVYSVDQDGDFSRTIHVVDNASWPTTNLQLAYNIIRGQISDHSTGPYTLTGNIIGTTPQPDWFWDPANGNLRLSDLATDAIGHALPLADVPLDFDNETRPYGNLYDVGADEFRLRGDADLDLDVDFADYQALEAGFGRTGRTWAQGDFDYDKDCDFADYQLLEDRFGTALNPASIPEPATLILAVMGGLALLNRKRSRPGPCPARENRREEDRNSTMRSAVWRGSHSMAAVLAVLAAAGAAGAAIRNVSTAAELQYWADNYGPGDEIVLAPGTYNISRNLWLDTPNLVLRGATGHRDDVILYGGGMNNTSAVREAVQIVANDITVKDLTISGFYHHAIHFQPNTARALVDNVHTLNIGCQHIKGAVPNTDGIIRSSLLEQTAVRQNGLPDRPDNYVGGIDLHGAANFWIHDNVVKRIIGIAGGDGGIFLWNHSTSVLIERNVVIGGSKGIELGNYSGSAQGNYNVEGAIVRNNFVVAEYNNDLGMEFWYTKDIQVYNNTVFRADPADPDWSRTVSIGGNATYPTVNFTLGYNIIRGQIKNFDYSTHTEIGNLTGTVPQLNWFVDPASFDLHLTDLATAAIGHALALPDVPLDFDNEARPYGNLYDVGADEYRLRGDADLDLDVDFADYQTLEVNFGKTTGATWAQGDFDYDKDCDFADYQLLEDRFGTALNPANIPEPATLAMSALGMVGLLGRRRR